MTRKTKPTAPHPTADHTPAELMRLLIDPRQALTLVVECKTAEALAVAVRQIGQGLGLDHPVNRNMLAAITELDLRGRQIDVAMISAVKSAERAIEGAQAALAAAKRAHAQAQADVLAALGYPENNNNR